LSILFAFPGFTAPVPATSDAGGVLSGLTIASFTGSGQTSIQAVATDSSGNIYVTGTTSSADFPVKNAAQPVFGESRILRSADLGLPWTHMGLPPSDVNGVVPDPVSPQIIFAGGNAGIFKSADAGQTWATIYPLPNTNSFTGALVIDPGNHLRLAALLSSGYLIRSVDGGNTWTTISPPCRLSSCGGDGAESLIADPTGSGALIVATFGLYISRDWGLTFQNLYGGGGNVAAFDPSNPGWIYVDYSIGVSGTLVFSKDFGATWTPKASPSTTFSAIVELQVDPNQPNVLVATTASGVYKSSDGANSWTEQAQAIGSAPFSAEDHDPFLLVNHTCSPGGGMFAIGSSFGSAGKIDFSPDDGATWTTPQLTGVNNVAMGPGCAAYVTRNTTTDAFVAKVSANGTVQWATYLGGSDQDVPVALAVDAQGNCYVAGNTTSSDFPATVPLIGVKGASSVFITKFSPDGKIAFSAIVSGEGANRASAIAVDTSGNVYVAGGTNSMSFPVTSGVLGTSLAADSSTGFLIKLSGVAVPVYSTYLGTAFTAPGAILVDANNQAIVAGTGPAPGLPPPSASGSAPAFIVKLNQSASQAVSGVYLPIVNQGAVPLALAMDAKGNLLIFGTTFVGSNFTATPGAYSSTPSLSPCTAEEFDSPNAGDAFLIKLDGSTFQTLYTAQLGAACGVEAGTIAVDPSGAVVLAMTTGAGLALQNPLLAGPTCEEYSSVIAKISADGSTLQFATYLDSCGSPGVAVAPNGSIVAGVSLSYPGGGATVLNLGAPNASAISINQVANAFSGDQSAVASGGLYTLTGSGFQPAFVDLGINPTSNLPTQLEGVKVLFDGVPASILEVAPGRVIVAAPERVIRPARGTAPPKFTSIRISYNGSLSNPVWMPVATALPGILTIGMLNPSSTTADGYVQNQDGTLNSATNPAPVGSTIKLFVAGTGAATHSVPDIAVYSTWQTFMPDVQTAPLTVTSIPGYISSVFQVAVPVPASIENTGPRVSVGLQFQLGGFDFVPAASNLIGVYIK